MKSWCHLDLRSTRIARIKNSLITGLLTAMISTPFLLLALVFGTNPSGIQDAIHIVNELSPSFLVSLMIQWAGILLLLIRSQKRLRPLPKTRVGPEVVVGDRRMVRFREKQLADQRHH